MIFFFKQKTAYEMLRSLVGSEMCIRDRGVARALICRSLAMMKALNMQEVALTVDSDNPSGCLLYTSDAADDLLCVDLGGRRITKKKKHNDPRLLSRTER